MKKIYKISAIAFLVFSVLSCKNTTESEHGHDNEAVSEVKEEEHAHEEEVLLTQQQYEALQMEVGVLKERSMSGYVEANGQLEVPPQNEAAITSVMGATIASIEVIEGDKVEKGQVVAYLSHPTIIQLQTDYLDAFTQRNLAESNYLRQQKLYEAGVGSGMNFQKAEATFKATKARSVGLESQLKLLHINANGVRNGTIYQRVALQSPIEGYVQKVHIKMGQYVAPQTELIEIVDTHHVHADLMVFEKDVHKVKEGQIVRFKLQTSPNEELTAKIISVGKTFEAAPKAVHVHAEIENKSEELIPGMYIQGKIEIDANKVTAAPTSAITKEGGRFFIFSAEKKGKGWSFKPIEVRKTSEDGEWSAISFLKPIDSKTEFARNNAYYLQAELKKGEAEHSH